MRISREWLEQYIDLTGITDSSLADALTGIGLEVEHIERVSAVPAGVVVGRIIQAVPHPNADSLRLCQVDVGPLGKGENLQIVCGAPNAREGIHVAVAMVGAELPGDFKIKEAKIRGEKSFGMMCSEKELGISDDHESIIELKGEHALGTPVGTAMGVDDMVMTLNVTPNRADCLSYIGVARDLSAKIHRKLKLPALPQMTDVKSQPDSFRAAIETESAGRRFCGIKVDGVKAAVSPAWMQQRLLAAGMRPINAIVDTTNYVMLEYGQPIHAYDERHVSGKILTARLAKSGEILKTLDGQDRKLETGDIVICDAQHIIGLAGIMGGANSDVKDNTSAVLIEVAHFTPNAIRTTSKRLGLRSEASQRFERGVDVHRLGDVAWRVAGLLCEVCPGAKIIGTLIDFFPQPPQEKCRPRTVALRLDRARKTLAIPDLRGDFVGTTLRDLGLKIIRQTENEMVFEIPEWRYDIEREADLVEEIARMVGFETIPYELPVMALDTTPEDPGIDFAEDARMLMAQAGLRETISFPFISHDEFKKLRIPSGHELAPAVRIVNPLSEEFGLMQTTLVAGLLKCAGNNERHGRTGVRLFEFGRAYLSSQHAQGAATTRHLTARAAGEDGRPVEKPVVAGIMTQPWTKKSWSGEERHAGFFEAKRIAWQWLSALGVKGLEAVPLDEKSAAMLPFMHPRASCLILASNLPDKPGKPLVLGYAGEIHPETAVAFDFAADQAPVAFEFDFDAVFAAADAAAAAIATSTNKILFKFPPSSRDVALLVKTGVTHDNFTRAFADFPKRKNLKRYRLFDVYEGANLPAGKKSMAYTFDFQSSERTLTDTEVEQEVTALVAWLAQNLEAQQR